MNQYDQNDTQSTIVRLLECISKRHEMAIEIKKEWDVTKCSRDGFRRDKSRGGIYAPRIDIAVGPFNIDTGSANPYNMGCAYEKYGKLFLRDIISKGTVISNQGEFSYNQNPRCTVAIEIEKHSEIKRIISDVFNASVIGKIGIFVYDNNKKSEAASHRLLEYFRLLQQNRKVDDQILKNVVFVKSEEMISILNKSLSDEHQNSNSVR